MSDDSASDLDLGATVRSLNVGQHVFGRYQLRKILGRGGMGIVWLARDEKLARDVALKFLPDLVIHDRLALDQLKHETNRSLELTHAHIVRVYDFVQEGNAAAAIAMEFVDGDNLSDLRVERKDRHFEVAELTPLVAQLCEALAYAHERAKIAHRDLKPANLMLNRAGELKVADFGIASTLSETVSRVSLRPTAGTLVYMSPQQLDGESASALDDIYAVGATLYDLLSGKPPFYVGNLDRQIREKIPPSVGARRAELGVSGDEVPVAWEQVIAACLSKSPTDRPQSAREIARRLGLSSFRPEAEPENSASVVAPAPKRFRGALLIGSIATLIVAAASGWWFLREQPRREHDKQGLAQLEDQKASEIEKHLVAGRYAMAQRQWIDARGTYAEALKLSPKNVEAREAVSKIDEHLAKARGQFSVATEPPGAVVYRVENEPSGRKELGKTPIKGSALPLGKVQLAIEKAGYEPVQKEAEIAEEKTADLGLIELKRSTGTLQVVTKPEGAEWELQAPDFPTRKGTAPATLRDLPTGDYQVHLRRTGWPEAVRDVKVERNAVGSIEWEFAEGKVNITSEPSGAEIFQRIPGDERKTLKSLGKTPLNVDLATGKQELTARYKEWPEQQITVDVATASAAHAQFKFEVGGITITSQPSGALVKQGKTILGKTPLTLKEVVPQNYTYTVSLKGYKDRTLEARVEPQTTREVAATLEKDPMANLNEGERALLGTWHTLTTVVGHGTGSITFSIAEDGNLKASGQFTYRGMLPLEWHTGGSGATFNHSGNISGIHTVENGSGYLRGEFHWDYDTSHAQAKIAHGKGTTSESGFDLRNGRLFLQPAGSNAPFVYASAFAVFQKQ